MAGDKDDTVVHDGTETTLPMGERLRIGDDLWIEWVEIASVKEQDVNAQQMQPHQFNRLTENIQQRGQLESLPYCHQPGGKGPISVISGHHRLRAARAAGLTHVPAIVDYKQMTRSEITARQIAHNALSGTPDEQVLRQLIEMIDNVDDMLMTGLDDEFLPVVDPDDTNLSIPHADFDWQIVSMLFLPNQLEAFKQSLDFLDRHCELVAVAHTEQFEAFAKAALDYGRSYQIKSVATAISRLVEVAEEQIRISDEDKARDDKWVELRQVLGSGKVPESAAAVVRQALDKMVKSGDVSEGSRWMALERWAADYLAG